LCPKDALLQCNTPSRPRKIKSKTTARKSKTQWHEVNEDAMSSSPPNSSRSSIIPVFPKLRSKDNMNNVCLVIISLVVVALLKTSGGTKIKSNVQNMIWFSSGHLHIYPVVCGHATLPESTKFTAGAVSAR